MLKANQEKKISLGSVPLRRSSDKSSPTLALSVEKHSKVRIGDVENKWLLVTAVNDRELPEEDRGWIHQDSVHWFAEAADMYTPDSPMNRRGSMNRLNHTVARMDQAATRFDLAAQRIEQLAVPFHQRRQQLYAVGQQIGQPISRINNVLGFVNRFASVPYIPNYPQQVANSAGYYAGLPGDYIHQGAGYVRIPANHLRTASGYVNMPARYAGISSNWASATNSYYYGMHRSKETGKRRKRLIEAKHLERVVPRDIPVKTILIAESEKDNLAKK